MNNIGLLNKHLQLILDVLKNNPHVEEAILFGSRALLTYKDHSDVDLALKGDSLTLTDIANLKAEFEESTLPYQVDLLAINSITNQALLQHIKQHGVNLI